MGSFISCCKERNEAVNYALSIQSNPAYANFFRSTSSDRMMHPRRPSYSLDVRDLLKSMRVNIASKGFFCAFTYGGPILETNCRARFFTHLTKEGLKEANFYDFIDPRYRKEMQTLFNHLSARASKPPLESAALSIPFLAKGAVQRLQAEALFASNGVLLFVPDTELEILQEEEVIQVKQGVSKQPDQGLWITNGLGIITDVSPSNCLQNLGYQEDDLIGKHISNFIWHEDIKMVRALKDSEIRNYDSVFYLRRIHKWGSPIRARVEKSMLLLRSGESKHVFIDTYMPLHQQETSGF